MKKFLTHLFIPLTFVLALSSCEKDPEPDDPVIPNEEEVITTLNFTLTPDGGGDAIVFSSYDEDGEGGSDAVITNATLAANTVYLASIELLNETEDPAENITEEIEEEDEEHQFFFTTDVDGMIVSYTDADENDNPIGLSTTVSSGAAATGELTIILKHEPDKFADGVSDGDMTNAGGETDIEITFTVTVE